jgi:putative oxidoreductase
MVVMNAYLQPLSRALVALIFILSGASKITGFAATKAMMAGAGFPFAALFLVGAIIVEIAGGVALLAGFRARWAALALFLYLIPATIVFHLLPMLQGGDGAQMQMIEVLKNLAIMGGLLKFYTDGAGAYAVDAQASGRGRAHAGEYGTL